MNGAIAADCSDADHSIVIVNTRERFPLGRAQLFVERLQHLLHIASILWQALIYANANLAHHIAGQLNDLPSRLELPQEPRLQALLTADRYERARHCYGRSYRDLVRGLRGDFRAAPDLVAYPESEDDIAALMAFCARRRIAQSPEGRRIFARMTVRDGAGMTRMFRPQASMAACGEGFYLVPGTGGMPGRVVLCPSTCAAIKEAEAAKIARVYTAWHPLVVVALYHFDLWRRGLGRFSQ